MVERETIGILGGTFDPIHIAHLMIAEECRFHLDLDRVFFVPAGKPPHKQTKPITETEHRIAMVQMAIATNTRFCLSRLDVDRSGPCYSVDTIELLRDQLENKVDIYFIIGMDSLMDIPTWHQPDRLIQLCRLAVVGRPNYQADMASLEALLPGISSRITFIEVPQMSLSSSDIRHRVRSGLPIKYQVLETVEEYIHTHHLYC